MSCLFNKLADLITNELAPGSLHNASALPEAQALIWDEALTQAARIKTGLWQHMAELKSKKEKAIWLEYCHSSCSILSAQLLEYEKNLHRGTGENHIRSVYAKLQDQLLELIFFMH